MVVLAWAALVVLAVCNVLLGRVLTRPPVLPEAHWTERGWMDGRTRIAVSTAGAAVLSADLNVMEPAWLQIVCVAVPAFAVGVLWARRELRLADA